MLFHKRTKKVVKYLWGFISILIVLSMVVTYSGFTLLSRTAPTPITTPQDITDTTPTEAASTSNTIQMVPATTPETESPVEVAPVAPPAPPLNFSL